MKNNMFFSRRLGRAEPAVRPGAAHLKKSTKLSTGSRAAGLLALGVLLCAVGVDVSAAEAPTAAAAITAEGLLAKAEGGDPWAQLNVGAAFDHGLAGFPLDPVRGVLWYRRAAEAGLPEAQFNLAHCLATGNGTVRDDVAALSWMLRAAEQGLPSAQFLAGVMYAEGIGTAADRDQAMTWLGRAADNGNLDAASLLQRLQGEGDGR